MNCPKCNSIVSKRDTKCPICGQALPGIQPSQKTPQQKATAAPVRQSPASNAPKRSAAPIQTPANNAAAQTKNYVNKKTSAPAARQSAAPAAQNRQQATAVQGDRKSLLLNIISFLFPIVGYLYFLLNRRVYPTRARFALNSAVASTVIVAVSMAFCWGYQTG